MSTKVPFFEHDLGEEELEAIRQVFCGPILTTGESVAEFERRFAGYLGRKHCIAVTSCTAALHLSLVALGIKAGDEVITTPLTFIATATAIIEAGAKPVLVDVEETTGNLDATKVEAAITPRTKAILPVHLYGMMADMRALQKIASRHDLRLVEDAAHCIEGERDDLRPGEASDTSCFSFFATKNLTCGEGGAIVTDSDALQQQLKLLRLHGMDKTSSDRFRDGYRHWDMVQYGFKCNMDNIHAAILLVQLKKLEMNYAKRAALWGRYQEGLAGIPDIRLHERPKGARHAYHLLTVRVSAGRRDDILQALGERGVSAMVNYRAIHLLKFFRETLAQPRGSFPVAERIGDETITLPFYPRMSFEQVDQVCDALRGVMQSSKGKSPSCT